jgi:hypothetical protein
MSAHRSASPAGAATRRVHAEVSQATLEPMRPAGAQVLLG